MKKELNNILNELTNINIKEEFKKELDLLSIFLNNFFADINDKNIIMAIFFYKLALKENNFYDINIQNFSAFMAIKYLKRFNNINIPEVIQIISFSNTILKIETEKEMINVLNKYKNTVLFEKAISVLKYRALIENRNIDNLIKKENNYLELYFKLKQGITYKKRNHKKYDLYIMIGLPNSGKSTYINKLNKKQNFNILSFDEIIINEFGNGDYNQGKKYIFSEEAEKFYKNKYVELINQNKNLIIDKTSMSESARKKLTERAKDKFNIKYIFIITDFEVLLKRNEKRIEKQMNLTTYKKILNSFEFPNESEYDTIKFIIN